MKTLKQIANRLALVAHTNFEIPGAAELALNSLRTDLPELKHMLTAHVEVASPSESVRLLETVLFEAFSNAIVASSDEELDSLIQEDTIGEDDEEEEDSMVEEEDCSEEENSSLSAAVERFMRTSSVKKSPTKKFLPIT